MDLGARINRLHGASPSNYMHAHTHALIDMVNKMGGESLIYNRVQQKKKGEIPTYQRQRGNQSEEHKLKLNSLEGKKNII